QEVRMDRVSQFRFERGGERSGDSLAKDGASVNAHCP
ncbi:MAG: hypothetical protein ACI8XD_000944, partial [Thermoproteota archaeon]